MVTRGWHPLLQARPPKDHSLGFHQNRFGRTLFRVRIWVLLALVLFLQPLRAHAQSSVPITPDAGWLQRAASRELARLILSQPSADFALVRVQQAGQPS